MFDIIFYKTESEESPVKDFLDSLPQKLRAKVIRDISILRHEGWALREPISKPIAAGLFELRTIFSGDIARVLYFFAIGNKIVLTHGFIKKTQKTPKAEIELALKYKADYVKRFRGEGK